MPAHFLNPTSDLFARTVTIPPGARVLLLHSDDPALARWAVESAGPDGQVMALHASYRALSGLGRVPGLAVSDAVLPDPTLHGPADHALLSIPKGREYAQAYLWAAARALRPGGEIVLAGPNGGGAKTAIKDAAALFGKAPVIGYKQSCRAARVLRGDDPPALPPDWLPPEPQTRTIARPEGDYTLITRPGVFSWDHLDTGTALLLDHLGAGPDQDVLDIGCGTGILGLAAARAGARVVMVDDDLLAVRCAQASAQANGLADRCTVLPSDVTSALGGQHFDLVLFNPPFHQGIEVNTATAHRFIRAAFDALRPGGRVRLVANRFLPYDRALRQTFGGASLLAETGQYAVWEARR